MTELSPEARALLVRAGDGDGPGAARRARVKRQLSARLAAGAVAAGVTKVAAAGTGQTSAGALVGAGLGKAYVSAVSIAVWLAGGALAGSLVMIPLTVLQESPQSWSTQAKGLPKQGAPRQVPSLRTHVTPELDLPAALSSSDVARPPVERERPPSREGSAGSQRASVVPAGSAASEQAVLGLQGETRLLEAAQAELAAGRGERALLLLSRHEREFPAAALSEERTFARVIALCQLGRSEEARAAAEAFLREAPRSPLVPRLRKSCAFASEPAERGNR